MLAQNLRTIAIFPLLIVLCLSLACTQPLEQRVAKSMVSGTDVMAEMQRNAVGEKRAFQSGTLWNLSKLTGYTGDGRYAGWVTEMISLAAANDPALRLVDSSQPQPVLPVDPGRGLLRFANYVLAPVAQPAFRARRFIEQFISETGEGYVLTHQVLVVEWAREQGLKLPASVDYRTQQLLKALEREQDADLKFSDLYAERAAILIMYGNPAPAKVAAWIGLIVDAQRDDGSWGASSQTVVYDGKESFSRTSEPSHTQSWALLALASYLKHRHTRWIGGDSTAGGARRPEKGVNS